MIERDFRMCHIHIEHEKFIWYYVCGFRNTLLLTWLFYALVRPELLWKTLNIITRYIAHTKTICYSDENIERKRVNPSDWYKIGMKSSILYLNDLIEMIFFCYRAYAILFSMLPTHQHIYTPPERARFHHYYSAKTPTRNNVFFVFLLW